MRGLSQPLISPIISTVRPLPEYEECARRLELVFPRAAFDTVLSNPLAAWAVASMIYIDAVVPAAGELSPEATWARPTMILWMSDEAYSRSDPEFRAEWAKAALRGKQRVAALLNSVGLAFEQKYGDNSRETLRDETFPSWLDEGALRVKPGVKTSSPQPRWALTDAFADLFEPGLPESAVLKRIESFRENHMSPSGKVKAVVARERGEKAHAVDVKLPDGTVRHLEPGETSVILKGVIEQWAPVRLIDPVVLSISEPGDKIYTADSAVMKRLGIFIDAATLLPDALLVDIKSIPPVFWVVEAVASDGPIDEDRKRSLLRWAAKQRIPEESCRFLTAFGSRNAAPAKRRLKDLATGTYAWYADEPTCELAWYLLSARGTESVDFVPDGDS